MAIVMFLTFDRVTGRVSSDYAERYAASTAEALGAHISKEIGLVSTAANSIAVLDWLTDEFDLDRKTNAYQELTGIVGKLYSFNLYIGVADSLNEYSIEPLQTAYNSMPVAALDRRNPYDEWFFECINSDRDYIITVDFDHIMLRKRIWLDYKALRGGVPLGAICTGLEFSHIAGELFSHYDSNNMRGLIIDKHGIIHMDSSLMKDTEFLYERFEQSFATEFTDFAMIAAMDAHLAGITGYWNETGMPEVLKLSSGSHRYMTIAPIKHTDWSVVILSDTNPLFETSYFIPVIIIALVILVLFAVITSAANFRLIFLPLSKLEKSLALFKESADVKLYGEDRDDELGQLSSTIQELFTKANVDPLTGVYNRRYMESSFERIMSFLSRSDGLLSVLMLDIDFFKKYNDSYGHEAGDKCLASVAKALNDNIGRVNDIVVRYGGEEFAVILPNTDAEGARSFTERLLAHIRVLRIPHAGNSVAPYVTVSVGVTTGVVEHSQTWDMFIKRADEALYMSKESGRDRYTYLDM